MFFAAIVTAVVSLASNVDAFWRLGCSGNSLVKERADPIVSPGECSSSPQLPSKSVGRRVSSSPYPRALDVSRVYIMLI